MEASSSSTQKNDYRHIGKKSQKNFYETQKNKKIQKGREFVINNKQKYETLLCHKKGKQNMLHIITNITRKVRYLTSKMKQIEVNNHKNPLNRQKVPVDGVSKYFRNTLNEFHEIIRCLLFNNLITDAKMKAHVDEPKFKEACEIAKMFFVGEIKRGKNKLTIKIKDFNDVSKVVDMAFDGLFHGNKLPHFINDSSLSIYDLIDTRYSTKDGKKKTEKKPKLERNRKRSRNYNFTKKMASSSSSSSEEVKLPVMTEEPSAKRQVTHENKELQSPSAPNSPNAIESSTRTVITNVTDDSHDMIIADNEKVKYLTQIVNQLHKMYAFFTTSNDMTRLIQNKARIANMCICRYKTIEAAKLDLLYESYNSIATNLWKMLEDDMFFAKLMLTEKPIELEKYIQMNAELENILKDLLFKE